MKAFIGVTDLDWYSFLSTIQGLELGSNLYP
jgi:hypothetical protein